MFLRLKEAGEILFYFTLNSSFRLKKSRYSGGSVQQSSQIRKQGNLLVVTVDAEEKNRLEQLLQIDEERVADLTNEYKELQSAQA